MSLQKISIIGNACSGKTTLGRALAKTTRLPLYHVDSIQFLPKFIDTLFGGSSTQLVMQSLGNHTPTADEIDEIQQLLNSLKKK